MLFRTELNVNKSSFDISYNNHILLIGSCFSDNIGEKLINRAFSALVNPFGTVYNAASIAKLISLGMTNEKIKVEDLDNYLGIYSHPDFHSSFNDVDPLKIVNKINNTIDSFHNFISTADRVIITLGTSWVYKKIATKNIVSNCHKQPQNLFIKELLSLQTTIDYVNSIINYIKSINSNAKVIFTISPVRHIKDGIIENQRSKAILINALNEASNKMEIEYFPSYEIMMDDLRDYRFYKEDMIHPSDQAIDYIWDKFKEQYFLESTNILLEKVEKIIAFEKHRPMIVDENYSKHKKKIDEEKKEISEKVHWSA